MSLKLSSLRTGVLYLSLFAPFSSFAGTETELMYVCRTDSAIGLAAQGTNKPFATTFTDRPTYYVHKLIGDAFGVVAGQVVASFNKVNPMSNYIAYLSKDLPGWHSYSPAQLAQEARPIAQTFMIRTDDFFVFSSGPSYGAVSPQLKTSYVLFSGYCSKQ